MKEAEFKEQFVLVFLATHCANEYVDACLRGNYLVLKNNLPVKEAFDLAESAWQKVSGK